MYEETILAMLDHLTLHGDMIVDLWDWNVSTAYILDGLRADINLLNMFVFCLVVWNIWLTYKTSQ